MISIGIDIGGTTVKLGAVENGETIIYRNTQPTPHEPQALANVLGQMIHEATEKYAGAKVGISMAGVFDKNALFNANQLGFESVPLRQLFREAIGYDVVIENDGVCALVAEYTAGALKGCRNGLMITLGTGVGGGVIFDGKPLRGWNGVHAELGHMITHADGKLCFCGQHGCWEAYASATALSELGGGKTPREILTAVREGGMKEIWTQYTHEVAQGLIGLCSIFAPEVIAIGGGVSEAGAFVTDDICDVVKQNSNATAYSEHVRIVPAQFRNDAGILGAAAIATQQNA